MNVANQLVVKVLHGLQDRLDLVVGLRVRLVLLDQLGHKAFKVQLVLLGLLEVMQILHLVFV